MSKSSFRPTSLPEESRTEMIYPSSLVTEKLRQTFPSRLAYHQGKVFRGGELPLSKQIGVLLWLNDLELLTEAGGRRRLIKLQSKASIEAFYAALLFRRRLQTSAKLQKDVFHHAVLLNSHTPEVPPFRRKQKRRIGVGYRDKGTLPKPSGRARREADQSAWFFIEDVGRELADGFPQEGDWVDLSDILLQIFPETS